MYDLLRPGADNHYRHVVSTNHVKYQNWESSCQRQRKKFAKVAQVGKAKKFGKLAVNSRQKFEKFEDLWKVEERGKKQAKVLNGEKLRNIVKSINSCKGKLVRTVMLMWACGETWYMCHYVMKSGGKWSEARTCDKKYWQVGEIMYTVRNICNNHRPSKLW